MYTIFFVLGYLLYASANLFTLSIIWYTHPIDNPNIYLIIGCMYFLQIVGIQLRIYHKNYFNYMFIVNYTIMLLFIYEYYNAKPSPVNIYFMIINIFELFKGFICIVYYIKTAWKQ